MPPTQATASDFELQVHDASERNPDGTPVLGAPRLALVIIRDRLLAFHVRCTHDNVRQLAAALTAGADRIDSGNAPRIILPGGP